MTVDEILQEMRGKEWDDPHLDRDGMIAARRLARDWADRIGAAINEERSRHGSELFEAVVNAGEMHPKQNHERFSSFDDAATCLHDDGDYIKKIADRVEAAERRTHREICHIISRLVSDSWLLKESDERNGKPYKLFGEPLTISYGRFACQLYRAAHITRKFWLDYLKETHSDPEGIDKHLRRCFRDRRCSR